MKTETEKKAGKLPGAFEKRLMPFGRLDGHRLAFLFVFFSSLIPHPSSLLHAADLFPGYGSAISAASVDADGSMPQLLVSTPSLPANGAYINLARPAFSWVGVSTVTATKLAGAVYTLQVDNNIDFLSPEVVLSTPLIVGSTNAAVTTGFIQLSTHTLADATTYYWRVFTQGSGLSGPPSSTFSFVTDLTPPAFSGFAVKSSTGGWLGESQWIGLLNGVTAQATVQDGGSGLAVSTTGFSVKYSSNGGVNWVTDAGWTDANSGNPVIAGETQVNSFAVYAGKLYAGTSGGKVAVFDGTTWSATNGGTALISGKTQVLSLSVYNNKLYAGTSPNGKVAVFDGTSWLPANGGNPLIAGETQVNSLAVYNGRLYAGTAGNGKVAVFDGTTWSAANGGTAIIAGETQILSLAVYNGKLYAGTAGNGKVAAFDGNTWSPANSGNPVIAGGTQVNSLVVYNGRLYAGTSPNGKAAVFDGANWSAANSGTALITGETQINLFTVYNGQLYAGTSPGGKAAIFDGAVWSAANGGSALVPGETQILSLALYNGGLYAGTAGNARVAAMSPLNTSLPGPDGGTSAQTLTANGALNFGQSPNLIFCNGSAPCSARNQVLFTASDLAGNAIAYGPYAVQVDTTPPPVPVMSVPADGALYSTTTVSFTWSSASDLLSGVAGFELQLSTSQNFTPVALSSFTVNLSTSIVNLSESLQYWRIRAKDNAGNYSAYASTRAFYVDVSSPVITNNQASPTPWYTVDPGAVFNVDFADLAGLTTAQYRVTSLAGGGGTVIKDWTNIYSNPAGTTSFTTDWSVDFAALGEGLNFVSVRVFNIVALSSTAVDAFVIRKDVAPPYVINNQAGDNNWHNAAGTLYNVDFADAGQGIASAQYMITSLPSGGGTLLLGWTDIVTATSTALYSPDWGIDFTALVAAATNYVSVRAYDLTGKTTTYYDAFYALKDVSNPSIINNQTNDIWRYVDSGAIYNVNFTDAGGSKLNRAQYSISSSPALGDGSVKGWTDIAVNISSNAYTQNWAVDFAAERAGVNYVSVRAYDNASNYAQQNDVFTVSKDTTSPVITNNQSGDDVWRNAAGTLYNVDFADALSGLATAQYRITSQPGQSGTVIKDWTDIYSNPAGAPAYTTDWPVDFTALQEWTPGYVSVRAYDLAGKTAVSPDVFHVWKDTTPPPVPVMSAPSDGALYSTTTVPFSWSAVSDLKSGLAGYELQLSTSQNFTLVALSSFTVNLSAGIVNLSESLQYWRIRAKDNAGNYSAFTSTRSFYVDVSIPVITNNQASPTPWYTADPGAVFNVDFADLVGLTTAQYRVTSLAGGGGAVIKDWTNIYSNPAGTTSFTTDWAVDFAALGEGLNFVSVRVFNIVALSSTAVDAFVIRKDVAPPYVINNQAGDNNWHNAAGTLYNVDFADAGQGIASAQYMITSQPSGGGTLLLDWTDIVTATSTALYSPDWGVDFTALAAAVTNYVSVRAYDLTGKSTTYYDAFYVLKDVGNPSIIDNQPDDIWRFTNPGAIYDVDFADSGGSKLNRAQYSISSSAALGDGSVKGWTDIAINISSNAYNQNWGVDFAAERAGVNYVSIRVYDNAGNYAQQNDVFTVSKDTTSPVITNNQTGDDVWRASAGTLYNVDFADALSGLATAQYRITSQPGQSGTVMKDWTDIYSNPAGVPAYTADWPVDFAALQEWTPGYVSVRAYDLAGKTAVSPDVFHVWKDTTPPTAALTGFSVNITTLSLSAGGADTRSGLKDYHFEVSPSEDFSSGVSSTNYTASNLAVFANMLEATTYYARVKTRDNAYNESAYSAVLSTITRGLVYVSSQSLAPINVLQGADAVMLSVDLVSNAGSIAALQRIDLSRTGTATAADFVSVKIYRDNNANGLVDGGDTLLGSAGFSGTNASVNMSPPLTVNNTPVKLLVVYSFSAGAAVGATAGVTIASASKLVFADPYSAVGAFPMSSSLSTITDGANNLNITATNIAPGSTLPGTANVPVIKLAMNTNMGTSLINTLNVLLAGTVVSNNISAVKLYLDTNGNAQFDLGDQLLSSGADTFLNYSSTITLTAAAALRTVGTVPKYMFVVVDVALDAPEGSNFTVSIPTSTAFVLNNPLDTPVMTPAAFTSGQVTVQTNNTANIYTQSLVPAEFTQGGLYAVALASASVSIGIAELNRVKVNRIGTSVDGDIKAVSIYKDQVLDGGNFNQNFDLFVGSAAFAGGVATIDITTVTVTAGATTQLFVVYEISPVAIANNTTGAGFTNTGYFRMASANTTVYGGFPYNTATAPIRATVNPLKVTAAVDMTTGELFQGTTNNAILRLDLKSELNPVTWTSLQVKSTGTLPDNMIDAVKLYRDVNGDGILTVGVDELVTAGNDFFTGGGVNLYFSSPQSVDSAGGSYFVTLDINAAAAQGYTAGVEITTTAWLAVNAPSLISTACVSAPYRGGPVLVKQYPNIVTVSTVDIMPSAGAYPDTANVPIFKLTLKTDVSTAKFLAVKFGKSGTLTDAEVKAVKVYYDINNLGSFNPSNIGAYSLVTTSTVTFGTDGSPGLVTLGISTTTGGLDIIKAGRNFFVVADLASAAVIGRSMTMRVLDKNYFTVSAPNTVAPVSFSSPLLYVRAPSQTLGMTFESKLSTYVVQGQISVLVASFTVTASSYSIDMSRIDFARGGNGSDSDISAIKLYRDNGNGIWGGISQETLLADGVFSGGLVSFAPAVQTIVYPNAYLYYLVADISETAAQDRTFGADLPAAGYIAVNDPHTVVLTPFYSVRAVIQPTVDTLIVSGVDGAPALTQADSNKVMGRLRMNTDARSALVSSIRFDKTGTTPDADITHIRVYKDTDASGTLNPAVDQLVGTLSSFSSGVGVMVMSPAQGIGTAAADYFVAVDISTLAVINTSFNLWVTPAAVSPDAVAITGSTITFTMAGVIADKPDTVYMSFSDIASRSLYVGASDNKIAKLSFRTDNDVAYLTGLKLTFTGTAGTTDIPLVKLYRDTDGNGYFDPAYDVLAATASISAGEAYLYPAGAGDLITASTRTYFVAVDIAGGAVIGNTLSVGISNENNVYLAGSDLVYPIPAQATANSTIRDPRVPTPPAIAIYKADGRLFSEISEAFNAYCTLLNFKWQSTVLQGSIEQAYYYIGPQPADDSTPPLSWVAAGAGGEISIRGLNLLNSGVYYLSVRVKNSAGAYYSDITSKRFIVDTVVPSLPGALTVSTEGGDYILNWSPAAVGISSIEYYTVEERKGNSTLWVAISTTSDRFLPISNSGVQPSGITRPAGAYFYRVSPVNNAGLSGPASEPLAVNIDLDRLATISDASFYPNPFDSRKQDGRVAFTLNSNGEVIITIYDAFGRKVKSLNIAGVAGPNSAAWDGTGPAGKVSMGMYLCVIKAGGESKVLKIGVKH